MGKEYVRRKTLDRETLKKLYQILTLIMRVNIIPNKFLIDQINKAEALMRKYFAQKKR